MMIAFVRESRRNFSEIFSLVTSKPGFGPDGSGFGLPSELKSTALEKFGGSVTGSSCHYF
jgi:hypothetical protein